MPVLCFKYKKQEISESNTKHKELKDEPVHETKAKREDNDIIKIVKDIEDENITDQFIIEYIQTHQQKSSHFKDRVREFKHEYEGYSILHLASQYCRDQLCLYLIDAIKIDKDIKSKCKQTPFQALIDSNIFSKFKDNLSTSKSMINIKIEEKRCKFNRLFNSFISRGVDYNFRNDNGFTALHYAVLRNNYEAVINLINLKNIELNVEDSTESTALTMACKQGFVDIALLLINCIETTELFALADKSMLLHLLCKNKMEKLELVECLLKNLSKESETDLISNKSFVFSDEIKLNPNLNRLLKAKDEKNQTILSILINNNHLKIIELLLRDYYEYIVDIEDPNGNLIIHLAAKNGSPDLLKLLIKYNAFSVKSNKNYENALHIAAANNKFNFIKEYLAYEKIYAEKYLSDESEFQAVNANEVNNNDLCTLTAYIPSVKCFDKETKTPLFIAVINGHLKCVEVLTASEDVDLEAKDPDGNSVYHICAELNNFESIRYLITRKEPKFQSALFNINKHNGNSVLHIACEHGNLEIIRLVFTSIDELSHLLTEEFIKSKNKNGHTCFHIACIKGFFNIVEYFAQDLRMSFFIEILDNELNNCLHLAAIHNNLNIAKLIIKHNIDLNQRNMDGNTVLDIGFQRGFFEIIKLLIMSDYDLSLKDVSRNECPLHTAAFKGAHEIVDLLLKKGLPLASFNSENKNCLEVALEQNHKNVIRILLKHKDWASLFNNKNHLQTLISKKMFDMVLIVLDNCRTEDSYDFKILDPDLDNIQKHPLMLFAQSGQETILKHPTVKKLLTLKWRLVPQIAFYTNLFFYFLFLVLFTIYSLNLSNHINEIAKTNCNNSDLEDCFNNIELNQSSTLSIFLAIIIVLVLFKTCFQILLLDGLSYFNSLENLSELFLYFLALTSLFSTNFNTKLTSASLTILLTFIVFTFLIQKLKGIGLYVLAFRRTLNNSAYFFPIFLLIFTGFNLSFRLQTSFALSNLSLSPGGLIIKTFVMVLGEFGDSGESMMGLNENSTINYVIYFFFISIVCAILVNLFIGIAVGEISTVLNEADVQQISMRIVFVLKVQKSLKPFISGPRTNKYLNLRFESYCYDNEPKFIKIRDKIMKYFRLTFRSVEPSINLVVPQERLEEKFVEVSNITSTEIKNVKKSLARQLTEIEHKLSNSQLKLENYLLEMQSKTLTSFEVTKEDSNSSIKIVDNKLNGFTIKLIKIAYGYKVLVKLSFIRIKQMFKNSFINFVARLIKRQEVAEHKIKNLGISAMNSQELFNLEFDARKRIINFLADKISNLNQKTKYLRAKMEEFENFHKKKLERDLLIEKFLEKASHNLHDVEFFKSLTKSKSKFEMNRMKFELRTIIQNKIINNRKNSKNNF